MGCASAFCISAMIAASMMTMVSAAYAEPGDDEAVTKARKDYAQAMRGHDAGLQNAMRAELSAQLAKSKKSAIANSRRPANAPRQNTKLSTS